MRGRCRAAAALVLAAGCGREAPPAVAAPIAAEELALRVLAETSDVELGVAFRLTVVRTWSTELEPEPWDGAKLAPLVVREVAASRREDGQRVEETVRYRGYAFTAGELTVPATFVRARARDGTMRIAFADDLRFTVRPALPPGEPGPAELPGDVVPAPRGATRAVALALGLVLLAGGSWFAARRRRALAPTAPAADPDAVALAALQRLRARAPRGRDAVRADAVEAAQIVRAWLEAHGSAGAAARTTEEIAAAVGAALPRALPAFLGHGDLVKFARLAPEPAERERWLREVEDAIRAHGRAAEASA